MDTMRQTARTAVRVQAWGVTGADVEHALYRAEQGESRNAWDFVEIDRLPLGTPCPIDLQDPKPIAAGSGYHWAYAVYPLRGAR